MLVLQKKQNRVLHRLPLSDNPRFGKKWTILRQKPSWTQQNHKLSAYYRLYLENCKRIRKNVYGLYFQGFAGFEEI